MLLCGVRGRHFGRVARTVSASTRRPAFTAFAVHAAIASPASVAAASTALVASRNVRRVRVSQRDLILDDDGGVRGVCRDGAVEFYERRVVVRRMCGLRGGRERGVVF